MISKRIRMEKQDVQERISNFKEIYLGYNQNQAMNEASRCLQCKEPNCQKFCPFHIDIPKFIQYIENGDFEEASDLLGDIICFPSITGRTCSFTTLCEKGCILGEKEGCEPVAIGNLERFIGDWASNRNYIPSYDIEEHNKSVAIIGSGISGMTVASYLKKTGYDVTIYEALDIQGGVLTYLIPEFRIPKKTVMYEFKKLEKIGVKIKTRSQIGTVKTLNELKNENDAIFIGIGTNLTEEIEIRGNNTDRILNSSDILYGFNVKDLCDISSFENPILYGDKVVIVGESNLALDCARLAIRLGATVDIFCKGLIDSTRIRSFEFNDGIEEGIKFRQLMYPTKLIGKNGELAGFEYCINKLIQDLEDLDRMIPLKTDFIGQFSCDHLINAIGRKPDILFLNRYLKLKPDIEGYIKIDPESLLVESHDKTPLFAGGDIIGNQVKGTKYPVINGIMHGILAAKNIDYHLSKIIESSEKAYFYH
jgi:glutamate synthase (NADPH/NADH) small chain